MKNKKILTLILIVVLGFIFIKNFKLSPPPVENQPRPTQQPKPFQKKPGEITSSVFIPYWSLPQTPNVPYHPEISKIPYISTNIIYFGIAPNLEGIDKNELGYSVLINKYLNIRPGGTPKHYLALRMTNNDLNFKILDDAKLQHKIRDETIELAKTHGFDGVVLDLEVSALPTAELKNQLTMFITDFSAAVKSENMGFMMTVYGDNFYRARPYDLASLTTYTDQFLLMMYDLHKAAGEPGPNFPLSKGNKFDYDLQAATNDFIKVIPPEKITVVFGLYGYDWSVADDGKPLKAGSPLTLNKIKAWFLGGSCQYKNCSSTRDNDSKETKVTYTDNEGQNHVIWFEDEESISKKIDFLEARGIGNFAFWAYGYY